MLSRWWRIAWPTLPVPTMMMLRVSRPRSKRRYIIIRHARRRAQSNTVAVTTVMITTPREITSPRTRYRAPDNKSPAVIQAWMVRRCSCRVLRICIGPYKVVALADQNERENEPCQTAEQNRWVGMEHHIRSVGRIRSKKPLTEPATNRDHQRAQNNDYISQHPKRANAHISCPGS
jgi:hypothetical protein